MSITAEKVIYEMSLRDKLTDAVNNASRAVDGLEKNLLSVNSIAGALGIGFGIAGIVNFSKKILDAGTMVEDARTGLTTLLRDATEAQSVISNTMEDAKKTPFDFENLLRANKALISAQVESKQAREDVLNLGNAISATGGGNDEMSRMIINLQQIKNVGKASALDIKQFAYAGINLYKVLEEAGIKIEKGNEDQVITYEQITAALKRAHEAGGLYANGLENMAGNTSVQLSNLGDEVFQLAVKMFDDLKPAITDIVKGLSSAIGYLRQAWDWAVKNKHSLMAMAKAIGVAVIAFKTMTILPPIILAVENALVAAAVSGASFGTVMTAALGPVGLMAVAIGGLAYAYFRLTGQIDAAREAKEKYLGDVRKDEEDFVRQGMEKYKGKSEEEAMRLAIKDEEEELAARRQRTMNALQQEEEVRDRLWKKAKGYVQDLSHAEKMQLSLATGNAEEIKKDLEKIDAREKGLNDMKEKVKTMAATKKTNSTLSGGLKGSSSKAQGTKAVTINVSIKELIHEQKISTTVMKESAAKIKELVTAALTGAINDFQITAGL